MPTETFGVMLQARIDAMGISRSDLSKALTKQGVAATRQTLWNWVHDECRPSHGALQALLDVLMVWGDERLAFHAACAVAVPSPA